MYKRLRDAWEKEKTNQQIQQLHPDFYGDATKHLRALKEQLASSQESSPLHALLSSELQVSKRLLSELLEVRQTKLLKIIESSSTIPLENLSSEEAKLAEGLLDFSRNFDSLMKTLPEGDLETTVSEEKVGGRETEVETRRIVVRLTQDLPAIVGVDLETYGPFKAEDVASLPEENALALVNQGAARRIQVNVPES